MPDKNSQNGKEMKEEAAFLQMANVDEVTECDVTIEDNVPPRHMLYSVCDHPPFHLTIFFGLQQALVAISGSLAISLLVSEVTCASVNEDLKARLLSSTLFMNGATTILMNFIGVGLPLYQGAASDFLVPLIAMQIIDSDRCVSSTLALMNSTVPNDVNHTMTFLDTTSFDYAISNIRQLQGSLIAAGLFQGLLGATGLLGLLLRFIGPNTIAPVLLLLGIYMMKAVIKFIQTQWAVGFSVCAIGIILSLYLAKYKFPIPFWNRSRGFHILWYPLHQVFSIFIAILTGWGICGILTSYNLLSDDPTDLEYNARTDSKMEYIQKAHWIQFPYPGHFGMIDFNISVFLGFVIASITSILDSVGDYYACSNICGVSPPPRQAINRGIAIEGFCSAISGLFGCGHGTTTYAGNIGVLGLTKVASRDVMIVSGVIYIVFSVVGKVSAVFISIPYPVLGGAFVVMFGMFVGMALSLLKEVDLTSTRNLAVLGLSVAIGLLLPTWLESNKDKVSFGDGAIDKIVKMLLANPSLIGGLVACFLDNTIPGTAKERGITGWQKQVDNSDMSEADDDADIYVNIIPRMIRRNAFLSKLPFFPPIRKL